MAANNMADIDFVGFHPLETSHPLSLKLRNFLLLSAFAIDGTKYSEILVKREK
jgi:hypothetical protein